MAPLRTTLAWVGVASALLASCGSKGGSPGAAGAASSSAGASVNSAGSAPGGASNSGGADIGAGAGNAPGAGAEAGGASAVGGANAVGGASAVGDIDCRAKGDGKSTITLINHCTQVLSFRGSKIEGGDLAPGAHACRDVGSATESIPAIRYWGFIGADPGGEKYTLAELTLNTDFNDFDWYNISHVDAHNLPMQIRAVDMPSCRVLTCAQSLLANCPPEGQFKDASGNVVSCVSPDRNDPNSPVAKYFEASCKDAYSWSGDDADSVVACAGEDYDIVFCP